MQRLRPRRASTGIFSATVVRKLGEPADVADDERLAERERADHAARRLAHRRRAQVDADVAGGHQRPEPLLVDVVLADDPVARRARAAGAAGRGRSPGETAPTSRSRASGRSRRRRANASSSCGIRLLEFRFPNAADERRALDGRSGCELRHRPGRMRDPPDRALEAGLARALLDVVRVDDRAPVARPSTSPARWKSCGRLSQSGGIRLSSTPWPSRRPTTPPSRSIASR